MKMPLTDKQRMVKNVWNKKKDYYEKTNKGNEALLEGPHYQFVLPYLKRSKKILEVGCGNGGALKTLHRSMRKGAQMHGVDISRLAISYAKKNFPKGHFAVA